MTAEKLYAWPDNDRIDRRLIQGRLVERPYPFRSPVHASTITNVCVVLGKWESKSENSNRSAFGYGCPYRLSRNPDTLLCADGSIIDAQHVASRDRNVGFIDGVPILAIEVLDPSDPCEAVHELIEHFVVNGTEHVWLIDPVAETVEICTSGRERLILGTGCELVADLRGSVFRCPIAEFFQ